MMHPSKARDEGKEEGEEEKEMPGVYGSQS
jgi:hypothetical protein